MQLVLLLHSLYARNSSFVYARLQWLGTLKQGDKIRPRGSACGRTGCAYVGPMFATLRMVAVCALREVEAEAIYGRSTVTFKTKER